MRRSLAHALIIFTLAGLTAAAAQPASPYAGQQAREIKALSAQEVDDLLNARGMALAKPAELNGYPGPLHSFEFASQLGLTAKQTQGIAAAKAKEDAAARRLGAEIVAYERELDQAFANRTITPELLERLTAKLGELQGRLRALHLLAHLETTALFTPAQIARYNELRGYTSASQPTHDPAKRNSHGG